MTPKDILTMVGTIIAALLGSGGITALYHEITLRRKVNTDAESNQLNLEDQKSKEVTELMKYLTDEIKRVNDSTNQQLTKIQKENEGLKRQIAILNGKLAELTNWIMSDNANYRHWLENSLRDLDPTIVFPPCAQPPKTWDIPNAEESHEESHEETNEEE